MTGNEPTYGIPVENVSGEDIPPRSVVVATGVQTSTNKQQTWTKVDKYSGQAGNIMVTGPVTIPATIQDSTGATVNGRGTAYFDDFVYVAIDPTETPEAGDEYGPINDEWYVGPDGSGFIAQGPRLDGSDPMRCQFYRQRHTRVAVAIEDFVPAATCPDVFNCGPDACLDYTVGRVNELRFTDNPSDCRCYEEKSGSFLAFDLDPMNPPVYGDRLILEWHAQSARWIAVRVISFADFTCCECNDGCMRSETITVTVGVCTRSFQLNLPKVIDLTVAGCVWRKTGIDAGGVALGHLVINSAELKKISNSWTLTIESQCADGTIHTAVYNVTHTGCSPLTLALTSSTGGSWPATIYFDGQESCPELGCPCTGCMLASSSGWGNISGYVAGVNHDFTAYNRSFNFPRSFGGVISGSSDDDPTVTMFGGGCQLDGTTVGIIQVKYHSTDILLYGDVVYYSDSFDCAGGSQIVPLATDAATTATVAAILAAGGAVPSTITVSPNPECYPGGGGGSGSGCDSGNCSACGWSNTPYFDGTDYQWSDGSFLCPGCTYPGPPMSANDWVAANGGIVPYSGSCT